MRRCSKRLGVCQTWSYRPIKHIGGIKGTKLLSLGMLFKVKDSDVVIANLCHVIKIFVTS